MEDIRFSEPVRLYVGLNFEREVDNAFDAYVLLSELSSNRRSEAYMIAREACLSAVRGHLQPENARDALIAFAEHSAILAGDPNSFIAAQGNADLHRQLVA